MGFVTAALHEFAIDRSVDVPPKTLPPRGNFAAMPYKDIPAVMAKLREPGLPLFLLGHSAGGVVACLYVLDYAGEVSGLICESFAHEIPYCPRCA